MNTKSDINCDNFFRKFMFENIKYSIYIMNDDMEKWTINTCECNNIIFDKYNGLLCPSAPYMVMKLEKNKIKTLNGSSGTLIFNKNHIFGMLLREDIKTNDIKVLHASAIYRFLNEFLLTNKFCGVIGIVGKFCDIEFNTENGHMYGIVIEDTYNINYNNIINKPKRNNLQNGDIIYKINNISINKGYILDNNYGIPMDIQTYVGLTYKFRDGITLNILRLKEKSTDDYDEKKITINSRPLYTMKYVQLLNYNCTYSFAGFIFTELTESIIEEYATKNIIVKNVIDKYLHKYPYRDKDVSVVVVIKTDPCIFDTASDYKDFFPLKHNFENQYSIGILKKVNKKKITNLNNVKEYIDKYGITKLNFEFDDNFKIHILLEKNTLIKVYFPKK
jgi:hypothetical protein